MSDHPSNVEPDPDEPRSVPVVSRVDRALHAYARGSLIAFALLLLLIGGPGRWTAVAAPVVVLGLWATARSSGRAFRLVAGILGGLLVLGIVAPFAAAVAGTVVAVVLGIASAVVIGIAIMRREPAADG